MNKHYQLVAAALAGTMAWGSMASAQETQTAIEADDAADSSASESGDIVVYGLKGARAQELQRTPAAITAVNAETIAKMQILDLADVGRLVPNAALSTSGTYSAFPNFQIRGVGVAQSTPTLDPAVTVSIDGMPYAMPPGTNIDTFDVESFEVLRGPQGVLQGRNSTGGVIAVRSRRPTNDFEAKVQLTAGSYNRFDVGAYVAGPLLEDRVLAKLAVVRRSNDSFFSPGSGGIYVAAPNNPSGAQPAPIRTRDRNISWLIRPTLVFQPTDNLSISLFGEYNRIDNHGEVGSIWSPPGGRATSLGPLFGYTPAPGEYIAESDLGTSTELKSWRGIADVTLDLPDIGVFTSITGYRKVKYRTNLDTDATPFVIVQFPDNSQSGKQFSQELRFASTFSDSFDILVGGYYSSYDLEVLEKRTFSGIAASRAHALTAYFQGGTDQQQKTLAGFANLSWHVTDRLTLTAGGRFTWEKKAAQIAPLRLCPVNTQFTACPTNRTNGERTWNDFSPRAGINFQATSDLLFYASYTKGFRSGAFNSRATNAAAIGPVNPESVTSWEGGVKATLFDGVVRANLTGFHTKYDDIQRTIQVNTFATLVNAADATVNGLEAELTLKPLEGLEINSNLGWLDAGYGSFTGLPAGTPPPEQLSFPGASKYTASLTGTYSFSIPGFGPSFRASATYNYRSKTNLDVLNPAHARLPGYGKLDLSLSASDTNWSITAFARNLNNARYFDYSTQYFSAAAPIEYVRYGGQPRTLGVELTFSY